MKKSTDIADCPREGRPRRTVPVSRQEPLIINAAAELFLERGYEGVSIDAITSAIGGSKRDIYALFGDKATLFRRAVKVLATERAGLIGGVPQSEDVREELLTLGLKIIDSVLLPRALALHRLMVTSPVRTFDAADTFLINAPQRLYGVVAEILCRHADQGHIALDDADHSASVFVSGLIFDLQLRALVGMPVSDIERHTKAEAVVRQFLDGCLVADW